MNQKHKENIIATPNYINLQNISKTYTPFVKEI